MQDSHSHQDIYDRNDTRGFFAAIPVKLYLLALIMAVLQMAPYWFAQSVAPSGWEFNGNLHASPDFIQYRVWMRQSQTAGVFVDDRFTSEPSRPFLPVLLHYTCGKVAKWGNWKPEWVLAYAGSAFIFVLTVLLFALVRAFLPIPHQGWWTLLVILIGGGLGAHLKFLGRFSVAQKSYLTKRLLLEPIWDPNTLVFEDYRGHYVFTTLFDTPFLFSWMLVTACMICLYLALRRPSVVRVGVMSFLFALTTFAHIYEGTLLTAIAVLTACLCWRKGLMNRGRWMTVLAGIFSACAVLAFLFFIQQRSGLPMPRWREVNILAAILFLAYPLAWVLIALGIAAFWKRAGLAECFMLGWAAACTAITLSGPFYPYPERGTMTLQIPIYILAALIYFARRPRVTWPAAVVAVLVLAVTPVWFLQARWKLAHFDPRATHMFLSNAHREILNALTAAAKPGDVLAAPGDDVLWLAPEFPGRHFCGHFFLTVDYERKKNELNNFFENPVGEASFLQREKIRFLFVPAGNSTNRFSNVPGLHLLKSESIGSVFEYTGEVLKHAANRAIE